MPNRPKILIVDDSELNVEILCNIIHSQYNFETACNGKEALRLISEKKDDFSLILLDLIMPDTDGFEVLKVLQKQGMLDELPVIIISAETESHQVERAYDLGAIDFISRPFDPRIVLRRIENTLSLYMRKKSLENLVVRQFFETQRNNTMMIEILANLVEFHNGETADHIIHIRAFTSIILHELKRIAPQYNLTSENITYITTSSSLHDIGKINIPTEILNKPGRLTPQEFDIMKSHAEIGAQILENSEGYVHSKLIHMARDVARWHHERWDGRGYPDGLKGDEIPIGAQVVALADVYDALTSKRCYKPAYSHEKAIQMILNGECGVFNPVIMDCLRNIAPDLKEGFSEKYIKRLEDEEIRESAEKIMSGLKIENTEGK